jgi:hypothetical protein
MHVGQSYSVRKYALFDTILHVHQASQAAGQLQDLANIPPIVIDMELKRNVAAMGFHVDEYGNLVITTIYGGTPKYSREEGHVLGVVRCYLELSPSTSPNQDLPLPVTAGPEQFRCGMQFEWLG